MPIEDQDVIATLQDSIIYDDPLYKQGAASRDAEIERLKRADFREMREMLRAMQAGELTVSRGIEILNIWWAGNWNDDIAKRALSAPSDTSELESYVAKAGEKMREKCAVVADEDAKRSFLGRVGMEIRALPGVTLEDLK